MKIDKKNVSETKVAITIELGADEWKEAEKEAVKQLAAQVEVPGFRAGKAPVDLAKGQIDQKQLMDGTLDLAIRKAVGKALVESELHIVGRPEVNVTKMVPGQQIELTVTVDYVPKIALGDTKKLKLKKNVRKIDEKEVDASLENVRGHLAEMKPVKRAAKLGDDVIIDFTGRKDGEEFEGGKAKDFHLRLGSGQLIPGFEDGIVGHEAGDRFDLALTFPENYHAVKLKGEQVVFEVLLRQVNEVSLPELNDKFAVKAGFKDLAAARKSVREHLEAVAERDGSAAAQDGLVGELVSKSKVIAPEVMVEEQAKTIKQEIYDKLEKQGLKFEDFLNSTKQTEAEWSKDVQKMAENRVKAMLVLGELARKWKIDVSEGEADEQVKKLKEFHKENAEFVKVLDRPEVRADIRGRMIIEKTMAELLKRVQEGGEKKAAKNEKK